MYSIVSVNNCRWIRHDTLALTSFVNTINTRSDTLVVTCHRPATIRIVPSRQLGSMLFTRWNPFVMWCSMWSLMYRNDMQTTASYVDGINCTCDTSTCRWTGWIVGCRWCDSNDTRMNARDKMMGGKLCGVLAVRLLFACLFGGELCVLRWATPATELALLGLAGD